jgi:hypothetical protein
LRPRPRQAIIWALQFEPSFDRKWRILVRPALRIPEALDRLIKLYTATDKLDEVKKWRAERAKYP